MQFGLSEEQSLLGDTVNRFCSDHLDLDTLKSILGKPGPVNLHRDFVGLGLMGVIVPETYGGSGLSMLDGLVITEALGAHLAPMPFAGTALVAAAVVMQAGTQAQRENYLPGIAAGDMRFGIGLDCGRFSNLTLAGQKVSGRSAVTIDVTNTTHFLLSVEDKLVVVNRETKGVEIELLNNVDKTRSYGVINLHDVSCDLVGDESTLHEAVAITRLTLAAESFGAAWKMFQDAQRYSLERYQFDRPIGSFQSIKHQLSDMAVDLEPCRSLLWYTAYSFGAEHETFELHACLSKSLLSDVCKRVAKTSLEIHGGMGYTELLGLHLWFKRIETNRQLLGGPETVRQRAAEIQGFVGQGG